MPIDHSALQASAGSMIGDWGLPAQLLRGSELRPCTAAVLDYIPRGKQLILEGAERCLIAAPLAIPPNHELDKLVKSGKLYNIVDPAKGPRPADIAVYYDLLIIYDRAYP